ncbi:hypothetical protein PR048_010807 [Dryococelus australis]|uniref:Uncharacterized protein n=1 Tax=Dryococelus australis TaxID=614101 RepID=A0ABQ9I4K1_9NEOP|nr:hypothetical protein PR048_010807 [Dryococelus australis]
MCLQKCYNPFECNTGVCVLLCPLSQAGRRTWRYTLLHCTCLILPTPALTPHRRNSQVINLRESMCATLGSGWHDKRPRYTRLPPRRTRFNPRLDYRKWESCWTMQLVGGFSLGSPVSPAPSFQRSSILTSITLIGSQDRAVKSHPNLFTLRYLGGKPDMVCLMIMNLAWRSAPMENNTSRPPSSRTTRCMLKVSATACRTSSPGAKKRRLEIFWHLQESASKYTTSCSCSFALDICCSSKLCASLAMSVRIEDIRGQGTRSGASSLRGARVDVGSCGRLPTWRFSKCSAVSCGTVGADGGDDLDIIHFA